MRTGLKSSHRTLAQVAGKRAKAGKVKRNEDRSERVPPPKPKGRRG